MTNRSSIRLGNTGFPNIPASSPFTSQTVPVPDSKAYDSEKMEAAITKLNETTTNLHKALDDLEKIDVSRVAGQAHVALEKMLANSKALVNDSVSVVNQAIATIQAKIKVLK